MNNIGSKILVPAIIITGMLTLNRVWGQAINAGASLPAQKDSLSIGQVIGDVVKTYPSVKTAEEAIKAADAKIGLAKSGYYPNLEADLSYTRIGPVPSISIPDFGSFELYPNNNYQATVNYAHTIWDFGRTSTDVNYEKENKAMAEVSLEDVKQQLALTVVNNFFTLAFLQEAIIIKDEELKNLYEHLEFVEKKKETGSATQYEILSTKVKISGVESQKVDLETALKVQLSVLNTLLGQPENTPHYVRYDLASKPPGMPEDSLLPYALEHRDEMIMARQRTILTELHYKTIKAQYYPEISLFASGGGKNGYFPDLAAFKANYTAGIGLRIPIYDASRTKYGLRQAQSIIQSSGFQTDVIRRNISNDVVENQTRLKAAQQKVSQYELQLSQALEAYNLAQTNFKAGAITNLDLLDASNSVSESRLLLLKSRIDYLVSIYKLEGSLGQKLY